MAFGAFELALEARLLDTGCAVWNEANLLSYVKYWSAISSIAILLSFEILFCNLLRDTMRIASMRVCVYGWGVVLEVKSCIS